MRTAQNEANQNSNLKRGMAPPLVEEFLKMGSCLGSERYCFLRAWLLILHLPCDFGGTNGTQGFINSNKSGDMSWEGNGVGGAGGHLWLLGIDSGPSKEAANVAQINKLL